MKALSELVRSWEGSRDVDVFAEVQASRPPTWFDAHEVHHIANAHGAPVSEPSGRSRPVHAGGITIDGVEERQNDVLDALWELLSR